MLKDPSEISLGFRVIIAARFPSITEVTSDIPEKLWSGSAYTLKTAEIKAPINTFFSHGTRQMFKLYSSHDP